MWRSESPGAGQAEANTGVTVANARSTAILSLPSGATVTYARLYWAAEESTATADTQVTFDRPGAFSISVTANNSWTATANGGQFYYQSAADVTALVRAQGNGAYRISGVSAISPLNRSDDVHFAAWALVVVYALPSDPPRNLAIFEGLDIVQSGTNQSATVSGFLVPNSGYGAKLGVLAYEGDSSFTGDKLTFNGTDLTNGVNPKTNFFNGSRSNLGTAVSVAGDLPQLTGAAGSMSGIDLDIVDVTSLVAPGNTSATTIASSTQDIYAVGAFTTSISTLKPLFNTTAKTVVDLNGGVLVAGDVLEYTISTQNTGTDTGVDVVLTDPLPAGVTLRPRLAADLLRLQRGREDRRRRRRSGRLRRRQPHRHRPPRLGRDRERGRLDHHLRRGAGGEVPRHRRRRRHRLDLEPGGGERERPDRQDPGHLPGELPLRQLGLGAGARDGDHDRPRYVDRERPARRVRVHERDLRLQLAEPGRDATSASSTAPRSSPPAPTR